MAIFKCQASQKSQKIVPSPDQFCCVNLPKLPEVRLS